MYVYCVGETSHSMDRFTGGMFCRTHERYKGGGGRDVI